MEKTMTAAMVVEHYKEVKSLLTEVGYSTRRRAGLLGKSAQTLKQYSVSPESAQHRRIPAEDLDKLRSAAIDEFWHKQWVFLSDWSNREGADGNAALPTRYHVGGQRYFAGAASRHFFLPRAQEIADETGGHLDGRALMPGQAPKPKMTDNAKIRSRWRKAVFALRMKVKPDEVKPILQQVTGLCEYQVLRVGIEYWPWRLAPQDKWTTVLEERIAEWRE
jgi:hypothetical protein